MPCEDSEVVVGVSQRDLHELHPGVSADCLTHAQGKVRADVGQDQVDRLIFQQRLEVLQAPSKGAESHLQLHVAAKAERFEV